MYDFVVVGAGPAGSRFARRAADGGHSVVVFERGSVGRPLACSGHVSTDLWEYLPDGARDDLLQNEIRGARFHVGGPGSRAYSFYRDDAISNVIDRVELDRRLAHEARSSGATILEGHTVTGVEENADGVTVQAKTPDGTKAIAGRMVAGCDGPVSRTRSALDLPEPGTILHGVLGFSQEQDFGDFVDVHLTIPRFFAWRIPRGAAGVEFGLAAPPGETVGELFEEFTAGYDVTIVDQCSGAIPIGPPPRTVSERGFLIGDAAAQTKPFTGGGILYGMRAADHAAETIDPGSPSSLPAYERAWRADLMTDIRLGGVIRAMYSFPNPVQHIGLRMLAGRIGVHMDRPTTLISRDHLRAMFTRN